MRGHPPSTGAAADAAAAFDGAAVVFGDDD